MGMLLNILPSYCGYDFPRTANTSLGKIAGQLISMKLTLLFYFLPKIALLFRMKVEGNLNIFCFIYRV